MGRNDLFVITLLISVLSCSTTKNIPSGDTLYTGIESINYIDADSVGVDDDVLDAIDAAFAFPPNNALFGSSTTRTPIPLGLWIYNANVNKTGAFNRLMMRWLAKKPVLTSAVRPDTRSRNVRNILRDNGYFAGNVENSIIPDKRDSLKVKIRYDVTFNQPYIIDSIEYRRMQYRGDTLLEIRESERLIRKGDIFNTERLEAERQRIAKLMRDNGYYYFIPEYIVYQADSTLSPGKVSLKIGLNQGVPRSILRPWKIGSVRVALNGFDNERPSNSIEYKDIKIYYEGKLRVRPAILYEQLAFRPGEYYSVQKQLDTQSSLNRLGIFRFTDLRYTPADSSANCDTLNVLINMSYDYPLNGSFELTSTVNDNSYAGPGASLNLTRRNVFGGGEVMSTSVYGSYEWYTGRDFNVSTGFINNYELGLKSSIMFPRLIAPHFGGQQYDFSATSRIDFNIGNLNRAKYYNIVNFGGGLSYDFQPNPIRHHTFTPIRLTFSMLQSTTARFDSIIDYNPSLYQSLQDQFIPVIEYEYTLDNSVVRAERSKTIWRFFVAEAGNLISGGYRLFGKKFDEQKNFLGNPYSQYIKVETELRYNHYISRTQKLATRLGGGVIYSYGNSTIAPYSERFYVGGANSIRAFTIRSIGPGRFAADPDNPYAYIDQNGDLMLQGNAEYRARIVGSLELAAFLDAGNVWLLRDDPTRPGGTFDLRYLFKDIALGTGLGFRFDMDMLIFRFDIGYALHFPYDTGKRGYFNAPSLRDAIGFHLALGYPF
ncbi:MAG: BamA/TamA family outer membrane protein [Tannerella sp.]|nr:BamA/TamA family outer membrane protein [Tannerella sp.]